MAREGAMDALRTCWQEILLVTILFDFFIAINILGCQGCLVTCKFSKNRLFDELDIVVK